MALSKEEIAIRVGVDSRGVTRGMVTMNNFVARSLADLQKKFSKFSTGLVAGFAVGAASDAVGFVLKTLEDGWSAVFKEINNAWYGFSEQAMKDADTISSKWKSVRDAQKKSQSAKDSAGSASRKSDFEDASAGGKLEILNAEKSLAEERYQAALKNLNVQKQIATNTEAFFRAEEEYYNSIKSKIEAVSALKKQIAESDAASRKEFFERQLSGEAQKALGLRRDLTILKDEPGTEKQQAETMAKIAGVIAARGEAMAEYYKPLHDALPKLDMFNPMREALSGAGFKASAENVRAQADALSKALEAKTLKVSIESIKE